MNETKRPQKEIRARKYVMADQALLTLAADIVSAHVSNNSIPAAQLPQLIEAVYGSLASLGQAPAPQPESLTPAVSVRASVKPDGIVCLECGSKFKTIKRHLTTDHQLSVEDYRARWNLPASYPFVAAEYAERRRALAKEIGLGRKKGVKVKAKKAHSAVADAAPDSAPVPSDTPADAAAPSASAPADKAPTKKAPAKTAATGGKTARKPKSATNAAPSE
ncbi:MucR family transcriptional regulator [Novosphingobium sp. BL-8H]